MLKAEIKDGGLRLHNIKLSDNALKICLLKRYLRSSSKWTIFRKEFELDGVFMYGLDYKDRIKAMVTNPFWIDVLSSLRVSWNGNFALEKTGEGHYYLKQHNIYLIV